MLRAWRIVKSRLSKTAFDGEGARLHGGRWNSPGVPMVYLAESRALALLEILVHLGDEDALAAYVLFEVSYDGRWCEVLGDAALPRGWASSPAPASLREIGDAWAAAERSVLLAVPSAVVPRERILLANPRHRDFRKLRVRGPEPLTVDPRLLQPRAPRRT